MTEEQGEPDSRNKIGGGYCGWSRGWSGPGRYDGRFYTVDRAQLNPQTALGSVVRMTGVKRESVLISKTLFRFVKQVASLAQRLTDAAVMQLSHPAGNGFAGWKHVVLLYLREYMDAEYEEVIDWAEEMERVRFLLSLRRGEFPAPSTLCKAFKRALMSVWRQLLRR